MSLEKVIKKVENFLNESNESKKDYMETEETTNKKVREGLTGYKEAENQLQELKTAINTNLRTKANELKIEIEKAKEIEMELIEKEKEPVTADQVAELSLISELDLTYEDLNRYINKYKRSPLAMQKLKQISLDKKLMNQFPPDKAERLNVIIGRIETSIMDNDHLPTQWRTSPYYDMIASSRIKSMKEDYDYYKSL